MSLGATGERPSLPSGHEISGPAAFGFHDVFEGVPHRSTAVAQGIAIVLSLHHDQFLSLLSENTELAQGVFRTLLASPGEWSGDVVTRDAIIETNDTLLRKGGARHPSLPASVTVNEPVLIEDGATIERSTIGPNVTIETGTRVVGSRLEHTIIGRNCRITDASLSRSLLGNHVQLSHVNGTASLGDHAELHGVPD